MLKRLSSAISTAHAISLAIREAPDAIRECVELARGNVELREELDRATRSLEQYNEKRVKEVTEEFVLQRQVSDWRGQCDLLQRRLTTLHNQQDKLLRELEEERSRPEDPDCEDYPEGPRTWRRAWKMLKKERREQGEIRGKLNAEVEFWKAACDRWLDWACHIEGGQKTPGVADSWDGDSNMMVRITAAVESGSNAMAQITEARELLSGLSSGLGYGLGGEDEPLPSMIERVEDGIKFNLKVMTEMRDTAQNERDELKTRVENQASEIAVLRNRVTELVCERDDLKSRLIHHEEIDSEGLGT